MAVEMVLIDIQNDRDMRFESGYLEFLPKGAYRAGSTTVSSWNELISRTTKSLSSRSRT